MYLLPFFNFTGKKIESGGREKPVSFNFFPHLKRPCIFIALKVYFGHFLVCIWNEKNTVVVRFCVFWKIYLISFAIVT